MSQNDRDDYKVGFSGATISKHESNKVGLAIIVGLIVAVTTFFIFGIQNKLAIFFISLVSVATAYFVLAKAVFNKNEHD